MCGKPGSPMKAAPRLNAAWHKANRMPPNATTAQRILWHQAHEKNCACRPIPAKLLALIPAKKSR
jgi:hypothetical protein